MLVIMLIDLSRGDRAGLVISPTAVAAMLMVHQFYIYTERTQAGPPSQTASHRVPLLEARYSHNICREQFSFPVYCTDEIGVRVKLS